jgi:hypothetical protein
LARAPCFKLNVTQTKICLYSKHSDASYNRR